MSKGSKRRPGNQGAYRSNYDRIFGNHEPMECPHCKEIELVPLDRKGGYRCRSCRREVYFL